MKRLDDLKRVLDAALAILEARDDQMLTQAEWSALAVAVRDATSDPAKVRLPAQVVFEDGLMMLVDIQNQGIDCMDAVDSPLIVSQAQIDYWARDYSFDVEAAKRDLATCFCDP